VSFLESDKELRDTVPPWEAKSAPISGGAGAGTIGIWRKNLVPTVMTLVVQSFRRSKHNYGLESIYLVRMLHSNFQDKGKDSLASFVEGSIGTWKFHRSGKYVAGFKFELQAPAYWTNFFQYMEATCSVANRTLQNWSSKISANSIMYEIRNTKDYPKKALERLECVSTYHCVFKYLFMYSLESVGNLGRFNSRVMCFSHDILVLVGQKRLPAKDFIFRTCVVYTSVESIRQDSHKLEEIWSTRTVESKEEETPFCKHVNERFEEIAREQLVERVALLLKEYVGEAGYLAHKNTVNMSHHHISDREEIALRKHKANPGKRRPPLSKEEIDDAWWQFLCCLSCLRKMESDNGLKREVLDHMGIKRKGVYKNKKKAPAAAPGTAPVQETAIGAPAAAPGTAPVQETAIQAPVQETAIGAPAAAPGTAPVQETAIQAPVQETAIGAPAAAPGTAPVQENAAPVQETPSEHLQLLLVPHLSKRMPSKHLSKRLPSEHLQLLLVPHLSKRMPSKHLSKRLPSKHLQLLLEPEPSKPYLSKQLPSKEPEPSKKLPPHLSKQLLSEEPTKGPSKTSDEGPGKPFKSTLAKN
jgi:hypothetical protein